MAVEKHVQNERIDWMNYFTSWREQMQNKLISLVLVVVGVGLLYWGYSESQSVTSQVSEAFSGSPLDKVMFKYIGGAIALVTGLYLFLRKR